jgi:copper homeostasis protein
MLRPRGGGFYYSDLDYQQMLVDAVRLLDAGADGITFGCLTEKGEMDLVQVKTLVEIIHGYKNRQAVINRAFDMVADPCFTLGSLAYLKVDRVLTSGGKATAWEGRKTIKTMQQAHGDQIEILAAGGVTSNNVKALLEYTGISQVHCSAFAHTYRYDPTTVKGETSYSYLSGKHAMQYAVVDPDKVKEIIEAAGITTDK